MSKRASAGLAAIALVVVCLASAPARARQRVPLCEVPIERGLQATVGANVGHATIRVVESEGGSERWEGYVGWGLSASVWWQDRKGGVGVGYCRTDLINIRTANFGWRKYGYFLEAHEPLRRGYQGFGGIGWTEGRLGNERMHYPWSLAGRVGVRVWEETADPHGIPVAEAVALADDQGVIVSIGVGLRF